MTFGILYILCTQKGVMRLILGNRLILMYRSWYSSVDLIEFDDQSKLFSFIIFFVFSGIIRPLRAKKRKRKKERKRIRGKRKTDHGAEHVAIVQRIPASIILQLVVSIFLPFTLFFVFSGVLRPLRKKSSGTQQIYIGFQWYAANLCRIPLVRSKFIYDFSGTQHISIGFQWYAANL